MLHRLLLAGCLLLALPNFSRANRWMNVSENLFSIRLKSMEIQSANFLHVAAVETTPPLVKQEEVEPNGLRYDRFTQRKILLSFMGFLFALAFRHLFFRKRSAPNPQKLPQ
jgi:hypothetical protein